MIRQEYKDMRFGKSRRIKSVFVKMKIMKSEKILCTCCIKEPEVKTVLILEQAILKNIKVDYKSSYLYCNATKEEQRYL